MDADRYGGFRALEARLPGKGTRLASHVCAEARDKDVISDRRDLPWSPENVLIDTVARLQRDLNDMRAESRYLRTPGFWDALPPSRHVTFTSTKVPRLAGRTGGLSSTIFEKTTRMAREDPSILAIALETLAVKAFGDMGQTALCLEICFLGIWLQYGNLDRDPYDGIGMR